MKLATEAEIADLVRMLSEDGTAEEGAMRDMLMRFPDDPRLHFLKGSILAGNKRPVEAHIAMSRAVELDPGFALARYQLGFFELTSGEPERALSTWGPLMMLPVDNYLRVFAEGMTFMIRDEFAAAIDRFQTGLSLNRDNEPMNEDIRRLIAECRKLEHRVADADGDDEMSSTALLLGRFGTHRTLQ